MTEPEFKEMIESIKGDTTKMANRIIAFKDAPLTEDELCRLVKELCAAKEITCAAKEIAEVAKENVQAGASG